MANATSNDEPENNEPTVLFVVQTPLGMMEIDLADLPEGMRNAVSERLASQDLPAEVRAALAKAVGTDGGPQTITGGPRQVAEPSHTPGCNCHQEDVWDIADTAFPNDPHLWKALESLFALSAANPEELTDEDQRASLTAAVRHLNRHIANMPPPPSLEERLIAKFRKELEI